MKLTIRLPYSYQNDASVPFFEASPCITVMDADCGLCAKGATWIAQSDTARDFSIVPLQSTLGHALMHHYGLDPSDPLSWLYIEDGVAYTSLDALIRVGKRLGGKWHVLRLLRSLPPPVQDGLYGMVARNRIRLSGRADLCASPNPEVQKRLIRQTQTPGLAAKE
ncbi:MAG: DUF393 domain-containing protein [Rhodobacteraceae bacterium]|nr:DUF393 domain-containing protein [Paracoccaceae bacterium]